MLGDVDQYYSFDQMAFHFQRQWIAIASALLFHQKRTPQDSLDSHLPVQNLMFQ